MPSELQLQDDFKKIIGQYEKRGRKVGYHPVELSDEYTVYPSPAYDEDGNPTQKFDYYAVYTKKIGSGSFATVYKANLINKETGELSKEKVALKVFNGELSKATLKEAAEKEAENLRIVEPSTKPPFTLGDGTPCLIMPFVEGHELADPTTGILAGELQDLKS